MFAVVHVILCTGPLAVHVIGSMQPSAQIASGAHDRESLMAAYIFVGIHFLLR
eukprot:m.888758 g.888758  ORF g.888758 m.888758 type:complete len:53 (+) comp23639_c1_seq7:1533-1691(+)